MMLFRRLLGDVLRRHRQGQSRTLRDVAAAARVSLGYLSEVERGRKEASSELLASVCEALGVSLADVLREVSDDLAVLEGRALAPVGFAPAARPRPVASTREIRRAVAVGSTRTAVPVSHATAPPVGVASPTVSAASPPAGTVSSVLTRWVVAA